MTGLAKAWTNAPFCQIDGKKHHENMIKCPRCKLYNSIIYSNPQFVVPRGAEFVDLSMDSSTPSQTAPAAPVRATSAPTPPASAPTPGSQSQLVSRALYIPQASRAGFGTLTHERRAVETARQHAITKSPNKERRTFVSGEGTVNLFVHLMVMKHLDILKNGTSLVGGLSLFLD